jgi:hypothetical protein
MITVVTNHAISSFGSKPLTIAESRETGEFMEVIFVAFTFVVTLAAVVIGLWLLGFQVPAGRAKPHPEPSRNEGTVSLPADLPPAVRRFFAAIVLSDRPSLPRLNTAVVWGRARQRLVVVRRRIWVPVTWRQQFLAGQAFYWSATVRWFRLPFGKGYDFFRDGHGEFGFGPEVARSRQLDQAENVRLWAESVWMPTVWLNDWRVQWQDTSLVTDSDADSDTDSDDGSAAGGSESAGTEAADHAWLVVPGAAGADPERLRVWFDPRTGLIDRIEARRFRGTSDAAPSRWTVTCTDWKAFRGVKIPARLQLSWDGMVYAELHVDGVEYNVAVTVR